MQRKKKTKPRCKNFQITGPAGPGKIEKSACCYLKGGMYCGKEKKKKLKGKKKKPARGKAKTVVKTW